MSVTVDRAVWDVAQSRLTRSRPVQRRAVLLLLAAVVAGWIFWSAYALLGLLLVPAASSLAAWIHRRWATRGVRVAGLSAGAVAELLDRGDVATHGRRWWSLSQGEHVLISSETDLA